MQQKPCELFHFTTLSHVSIYYYLHFGTASGSHRDCPFLPLCPDLYVQNNDWNNKKAYEPASRGLIKVKVGICLLLCVDSLSCHLKISKRQIWFHKMEFLCFLAVKYLVAFGQKMFFVKLVGGQRFYMQLALLKNVALLCPKNVLCKISWRPKVFMQLALLINFALLCHNLFIIVLMRPNYLSSKMAFI